MKILNKYILTITFNCLIPLFIIPMLSSSLYSQQQVGFILKGKVYSSATRKPVDFATVIVLEAKRKARTQEDGSYEITVPETGEYTIIVRSSGMKMFKTKIKISRDLNRNFTLMPISIKGAALTIIGERDIQKVSRRTMTVEDLKETPASFGDSINALSSLPGVDRTDGFFGPLVIRGMYPDRNRYYIDGMPINNPMHFGGIHSVINNNLMSEVDLYASAFPSQFGGPLAAVIDINTQDTVKEFGGYTDIGIISASALVQTPITRSVINGEEIKEENAGYLITSGRYGYLSLIVPYIIEMTTDNDVEFAPEYYDYQVKGKYYINDHNSISILFIGSFDKMKFLTSEDAVDEDEGEDPLVNDFELQSDEMFNNFGFYYTYQLDRLKNRVMLYASLSRHIFHMKSGQEDIADWIKDFNQNVKPYIYGIKNDFNIEWWERRSMLRGNIEYTLYHFTATGNSIIDNSAEEGFDIADNDRVRVEELDLKFVNHSMGGYLDNKFTLGGLIFVPGVRFDYYFRSKETTVDPRGMISYEFSTDTTISAAGGQYSSHFQLNPFLFYVIPEVCDMDYADPENSYHTVIGIEQVIGLYTFGIEFYYNY
ncbi:MAG: TonB-dependent receptor, partial [Spirochaetota bacterium]|nr:TonB-dependent receptor [Spirochaetota bacterium]